MKTSHVMKLLLVLVTTMGLATAVQAAPTQCSLGDMTRTIEVVYGNPGQPLPCTVAYEKSDEPGVQSLWRAQNEAGYCEARMADFVSKLVNMGWQCSEAEDMAVEEAELEASELEASELEEIAEPDTSE